MLEIKHLSLAYVEYKRLTLRLQQTSTSTSRSEEIIECDWLSRSILMKIEYGPPCNHQLIRTTPDNAEIFHIAVFVLRALRYPFLQLSIQDKRAPTWVTVWRYLQRTKHPISEPPRRTMMIWSGSIAVMSAYGEQGERNFTSELRIKYHLVVYIQFCST